MKRVLRRWAMPMAVVGMLVAVWYAAALSSPQINNVPVPPLSAEDDTTATESPAASVSPESEPSESTETATEIDAPDEREGLMTVVVLVVVAVAAGIAGWAVVRRRTAAAGDEPVVVARPTRQRRASPAAAVVAAVEAGLSELSDTDADPRRAVIGCWVRLEEAAASAGTPRHVGDSPTDLVGRLLATHLVSPAALDGLTAVYHEARYATHVIDERMRSIAVSALLEVRSELDAEAGIGGGRG